MLHISTTYGVSSCAIFLNTPGTAAFAVTCVDSCPVAKQGKGDVVIGISMMSLFRAAFVGLVGLIFLSPHTQK
ncbi:MAG: tripartite tricarboxylate transporter permease [Desulfobacteraceae bacterium]|nr:tripartite tricarboxylate transporter permease [Desulfobacteraceae bacterium]